jgi:hypothetical protein
MKKFLVHGLTYLNPFHRYDSSLEVQRKQLQGLRRFIAQKCRGQPFLLTGDFNRDAIESHGSDSSGAFGYIFRPVSRVKEPVATDKSTAVRPDATERGPESAEYRDMVSILDPHGELVDLLLESQGAPGPPRQHPCTRPPRLRIPAGNSVKSLS